MIYSMQVFEKSSVDPRKGDSLGSQLIHRDEKTMVDARKEFYARAEEDAGSDNEKALVWGKFTGEISCPI